MGPALGALGLNAAGQKGVTGGLDALAAALEPFKEWDAADLSEWLKTAQTYRDTGIVPDPAPSKRPGRSRPAAAPKAPKKSTAEVVTSLRHLQGRGDADPAAVKAEVDALGSMTVPQLKEVLKEFSGGVVGKTKVEMLNAIRKRINDHHASRDRVGGILAQ